MNNEIKSEIQGIKIFKDLSSANFHLEEFEEGENIYIQEEGLFTKINGALEKIESNIGIKMTQYDINKNVYAQLPIKTEEEIEELKKVIREYNEYVSAKQRKMLLCRELNYYTIFEADSEYVSIEFDNLEDAVVTCAQDVGDILDIQPAGGACEIWIKTSETGEAVVMYLFNCEGMFVGYRG